MTQISTPILRMEAVGFSETLVKHKGQYGIIIQKPTSTPKMEAARCVETLLTTHKTIKLLHLVAQLLHQLRVLRHAAHWAGSYKFCSVPLIKEPESWELHYLPEGRNYHKTVHNNSGNSACFGTGSIVKVTDFLNGNAVSYQHPEARNFLIWF
jgi:hypothetical protein